MKLRVALLCLGVALFGTVAAAVAGDPGAPKLKAAKQKSGPYHNQIHVNVGDQRRRVFVRVISTHDSLQQATITEGLAGPGDPEADYQIDWFRKDENVSHDIQTSGYEFNLKPDAKKLFHVKLRANVGNPDPFCLYTQVTVDQPPTGAVAGPFIAVNGPLDEVCVP